MAVSFSYCGSTVHIMKIESLPINKTIQMHSHAKNGYELHFINYGKGMLDLPDGSFKLSRGSLFVTGPNVLHKQIPDTTLPMHEMCIYMVIKNTEKSSPVMKYFTAHPFWIGSSGKTVENLIKKIIEENEKQLQWSESLISSYVIELIVEMVKLYTPPDSKFISDIKTDLNESRAWILDQLFYNSCADSTLEDFAGRLGVCPRQAERIIMEAYGSTFKKLRSEARMAKAAALLENDDLSIEQCASQCGYASVTSFNKAFRGKYGITPKQYRLRFRSPEEKIY